MNDEEKLKANIRFLLKSQLAFESYEDDNAIQIPLIREVYVEQGEF